MDVLVTVNAGLRRARDEHNARQAVRDGREPPYEYGIIVCALRMFQAPFSDYYREFCEMHKHEPEARVFGLASMSLITAATVARRKHEVPVDRASVEAIAKFLHRQASA